MKKKSLNGFVPVVGVGKKEKKGIWGGLGNLVNANRQKPSNTEWGWYPHDTQTTIQD